MNMEFVGMKADFFVMFYVGMLLALHKGNVRSWLYRAGTLAVVLGVPLSTIFPLATGFHEKGGFEALLILLGVGALLGLSFMVTESDHEAREYTRAVMSGLVFHGILTAMFVNVFTSIALDFGFFAKMFATMFFSLLALLAYWAGYQRMKKSNAQVVYIIATILMYAIWFTW